MIKLRALNQPIHLLLENNLLPLGAHGIGTKPNVAAAHKGTAPCSVRKFDQLEHILEDENNIPTK